MLQTMAHVIHLSLLQLGMFIVITVTCNLKDYLKGHRLDLAMQIHFNTFLFHYLFLYVLHSIYQCIKQTNVSIYNKTKMFLKYINKYICTWREI